MTRRDDQKPAGQTAQDALQNYLQQMLTDAPASLLADARPQVDEQQQTIEQKLLRARVKDLAEKSLLAVREQIAQQQAMQQKAASPRTQQPDVDRRESMEAARELVKQRMAESAAHETPADGVDYIAPVGEPDVSSLPVMPKPQAWLDNGRPVWAQHDFECLLFSVGGLPLAVPLVELGSIYPIRDQLTPIIGQIDWFLGLLHVHGRSHVRTVNTAKIVMPEKYDPAFVDNIRYVISINGYDWGLAVDNIDKAITLSPDAVRWRTGRSKRPWLAGTVVGHMCALLDVAELAVMLSSADHGRPSLQQ